MGGALLHRGTVGEEGTATATAWQDGTLVLRTVRAVLLDDLPHVRLVVDRLLDVSCEFDALALARERDPKRTIAEVSRHVAEEQARGRGGVLRHSEPREIIVHKALTPTGSDVLLVASRWVVDA